MSFDILGVGGFIFGIIGILVGIFVPLYLYRKSLRPKQLAIAYTDPMPMFILDPRADIPIGDTRTRSFLLLWNSGSAPIVESDFIRPITVDGPVNINTLEIHKKDAASAVQIEKARQIRVSLLRPNEAVILEVIGNYDEPLSVTIDMVSADMSVLINRDRCMRWYVTFTILILPAFAAASLLFSVLHYWGVDESKSSLFAFVLFTALTFFTPELSPRFERRIYPSIPISFFEIKQTTTHARRYAMRLRRAFAQLGETEA
ncbi:MAG TPA: hypothetical protein VH206_06540 [Xanthobacteraceae bacterium]|jgi:hypothetical protein|nr:hypothetical protein [Xanthobacteraceae bacterium]